MAAAGGLDHTTAGAGGLEGASAGCGPSVRGRRVGLPRVEEARETEVVSWPSLPTTSCMSQRQSGELESAAIRRA